MKQSSTQFVLCILLFCCVFSCWWLLMLLFHVCVCIIWFDVFSCCVVYSNSLSFSTSLSVVGALILPSIFLKLLDQWMCIYDAYMCICEACIGVLSPPPPPGSRIPSSFVPSFTHLAVPCHIAQCEKPWLLSHNLSSGAYLVVYIYYTYADNERSQ